MKVLVVLSLFGLACGLPAAPLLSAINYHEAVGIPKAALIKSAEEAIDFSGSRIVGGSAASLGQYPHMGGLIVTLTTGSRSVCGSSLLTNNRAVTAAHCWFDSHDQARQFTVVLGSSKGFHYFVSSSGEEVLIGITSLGPGWLGCQIGLPAVFTKVTSFNDWIRAQL